MVAPSTTAVNAGAPVPPNKVMAARTAALPTHRISSAFIAVSRVTVRTNIDRLVGGAGEETVIARVGEGMVSTIGSAESHKDVLENPDHISKHILSKGLDAGTAYEILSIDIADVDVGENIGAKLQIDQANADKQIAQAKAEERRAMAVALEQEMRARVVEAEAEVPRAMAEAFRAGNLGIMDYYKMKNVQADTEMRSAIADDRDIFTLDPEKLDQTLVEQTWIEGSKVFAKRFMKTHGTSPIACSTSMLVGSEMATTRRRSTAAPPAPSSASEKRAWSVGDDRPLLS